MKQLFSILMALFMLMSITAALCEAPASMENLLPLWDFEQGDVTQDGYYEFGCKIVDGGANGTAHSMRIRNANSGNGQWLNGLKPDTKYEVTAYAKWENRDASAYPTFGVNGYDDTGAYVAIDGADGIYYSEEWTQYTLQFRTGPESTQALVYTWTFGEGDVDFFIDEVVVYEVNENLLSLWNFEQGDVTQDGYYEYGCKIVDSGANGTAHSMRIRNANSGNGQWLNGLKPATEYEVTVFAKWENRDASAYPTFGVNGYDDTGAYVAVDGADGIYYSEEWTQYALKFCTGPEATQALVYTWTFGEGDVDFFIDEVVVRELGPAEKAE